MPSLDPQIGAINERSSVSDAHKPSRFQLDAVLNTHGMRLSIWDAGWPAAIASSVALR